MVPKLKPNCRTWLVFELLCLLGLLASIAKVSDRVTVPIMWVYVYVEVILSRKIPGLSVLVE